MQTDVLVVGAGPAGLAVAACLIGQGIRPAIIEKAGDIAASWRHHYDRLHLHTVKEHSALPGLPYPKEYPRYVPRAKVVEYLASYARHFDIAPHLDEEASAIARAGGGRWQTTTRTGRRFLSDSVVIATGANNQPSAPTFPGQEHYGGELSHSRSYRNPAPFAGKRVLVAGMGNTGAEIALDLAEQGIATEISIRSPINVVYRDVLGRPTQLTSMALSRLPASWGDAIAGVLRDLTVGDLSRYGIETSKASPLHDLRVHGRTPVIDVGTVARIKAGDIGVRPGIREFTHGGVRFADGTEGRFDAVIMATGYRAGVADLFPDAELQTDAKGLPLGLAGNGALSGVFFVGFDVRQAGGLLRTIGMQARELADSLARKGNRPHPGAAQITPSGAAQITS